MDTLRTPTPSLRAEAVTRRGTNHSVNEDCYFADTASGLFTLADGMGGHRDGDLASQASVEAVARLVPLPATSHEKLLIAVEAVLDRPDTRAATDADPFLGQLLQVARAFRSEQRTSGGRVVGRRRGRPKPARTQPQLQP